MNIQSAFIFDDDGSVQETAVQAKGNPDKALRQLDMLAVQEATARKRAWGKAENWQDRLDDDLPIWLSDDGPRV